MNAQETVSVSGKLQANGAMIHAAKTLGESDLLPQVTQTATAVHTVPLSVREEAAKFREEIRRRYETPFVSGWDHGGLNE